MARPRQITDEDILAHARAVFLEHGPHASTQVVADRCGLSQAALFKRFGTKRDLLVRALLPPRNPPFIALLATGPQPGDLEPQMVDIGMAISLFFRDQVPCMATLSASGLDAKDLMRTFDDVPPPIRLQRAVTGWLEAAGDRIDPAIDRRALATAFLGSLHVRAFFSFIGGSGLPEDPSSYVRTVVHALLHGVGVTP